MQRKSIIEEELKLTGVNFLSFGITFTQLVGEEPFAEIIAQREDAFAHEGPVYLPSSHEVICLINCLNKDPEL